MNKSRRNSEDHLDLWKPRIDIEERGKNLLKIFKDSSITLKLIYIRYKNLDKKIKKISNKINI